MALLAGLAMVAIGAVVLVQPNVLRRLSMTGTSSSAPYRIVGVGFILMGSLWVISELHKG